MSTPSESSALAKAINRLADVHEKQLGAIAAALQLVGTHLKYLGNGEAATQVGALENLSITIKNAAETLSSSLNSNNE